MDEVVAVVVKEADVAVAAAVSKETDETADIVNEIMDSEEEEEDVEHDGEDDNDEEEVEEPSISDDDSNNAPGKSLPILSYIDGVGYPKMTCQFCGNMATQHYCRQATKSPLFVLDNEEICGKAFCHLCTSGIEDNRTTCPDCFQIKNSSNGGGTKQMAGIHAEYNEEALEKKSHLDLKKLCDTLGYEYGNGRKVLRKKALIALILQKQKE